MDLKRLINGPWASVRPALASEESESPGTETLEVTKTKVAKPWKVIVHDDPITPMSYVSKILQEQFGYSQSKDERLMLQVHHTGRAVVWTGARETAEVHVQKLHRKHLRSTLESGE
ncbi:MAG: ATP-dependent Clp protease adapter ClpS [Planctomycetota bacterium]